jgi:hypothetical protein
LETNSKKALSIDKLQPPDHLEAVRFEQDVEYNFSIKAKQTDVMTVFRLSSDNFFSMILVSIYDLLTC